MVRERVRGPGIFVERWAGCAAHVCTTRGAHSRAQLQARLKALDFEMHRAEDEKIKAAFIAKAYSRKKYPVTGIFKERFGEEYPHHPR